MLKSLSKTIAISVLLSANAIANPQLLIEGEFDKNPSKEARFAFLQYEYAKESRTQYGNSECHILLGMDANRVSPEQLEILKTKEPSKYRDRSYCAFFKANDDYISKNLKQAENWIKNNELSVIYHNSQASILDNIVNAGLSRGFNNRLCKSMHEYMPVFENQLGYKNQVAAELYKTECNPNI